MKTKEITKIKLYETVKKFIEKSNNLNTIKCMLLDTLDNSKNAYELAEDAYYNYIKK